MTSAIGMQCPASAGRRRNRQRRGVASETDQRSARRRRVPGDHEPVARPGPPRRAHRRGVARVGPPAADGAVRRAWRCSRSDDAAEQVDRSLRRGRSRPAARRGSRVRPASGIAGWVALNRRSVVNAEPVFDLGVHARASRALRSSVVVPLVDNGTVVAVLALYSKDLLGVHGRSRQHARAARAAAGARPLRSEHRCRGRCPYHRPAPGAPARAAGDARVAVRH